jgi:anti-anti-sigma factor
MTALVQPPPWLRMRERFDEDDGLRLALGGELDLAVIDALHERLVALNREGCRVRLGHAQLEFIDSTGVRELIRSATDAKRDGWDLEIDAEVSTSFRRVIEIAGVEGQLWPDIG